MILSECRYDAVLKNTRYPNQFKHLSLLLESLGEARHVVLEGTVVAEELNVGTVDLDAAGSLLLEVLLATERSEAPVLGDNDLLATRELVLGAAEGLKSEVTVWKFVSLSEESGICL